jgi:hypothetical protein
MSLERMGRRDEAKTEYAKLLSDHPRHRDGHWRYARLLYRAGDREGAARAVDACLAAAAAEASTLGELDLMREQVADAIRRRNLGWAALWAERALTREPWVELRCLQILIGALQDGEAAAVTAWAKDLGDPWTYDMLLELSQEFAPYFADAAARERFVAALQAGVTFESVVVVESVDYTVRPRPQACNPFLPGDVICSYHGIELRAVEDLRRAKEVAAGAGVGNVVVVIERFGTRREVEAGVGTLGVRLQATRRRAGQAPTADGIVARRARIAYDPDSPLRTAEPGSFPAELSWRSCAADFAVLLAAARKRDGDDPRPSQRQELADLCYDAACAHSMASVEARESPDEAQALAQRAVELLAEALALGWSNLPHLQTDADLDPVRAREDFQRAVAAARTAGR